MGTPEGPHCRKKRARRNVQGQTSTHKAAKQSPHEERKRTTAKAPEAARGDVKRLTNVVCRDHRHRPDRAALGAVHWFNVAAAGDPPSIPAFPPSRRTSTLATKAILLSRSRAIRWSTPCANSQLDSTFTSKEEATMVPKSGKYLLPSSPEGFQA